MRRTLSMAVLTFLVGTFPLVAAPVPAAKNGLSQIPASAPVVIQMRGLEGTVNRLISFLQKAVPDHAALAELFIKNGLEGGVDGRSFKALAKDGPHFLALLELPKPDAEGPPKAAIVISTTNNKMFLDSLLKESEKKALKKEEGGYSSTVIENNGEPLYIVEREGFVIFAPRKEAAIEMAKKGVGIDGRISEEQMEKLLALDLGVYLSMDIFNKDYAEQIKLAKKEAVEQLKNQAENTGLDKNQLQLATTMVNSLFQATEDSKGIVLGLDIRPTALGFHVQSEVRAGTPTAKALGDVKIAKFEDLGKLPGGQMFYIGGEMNQALLDAIKGSFFGQVGDPNTEEGKAALKAVETLLAAKPTTVVQSSTVPTSGVQVWQAENPQAMVDGQIALFKSFGAGANFGGFMLKEKPTIKANAQKYKNISFTQATLKPDLDKLADQFGGELPEEFKKAMGEGMKKLIGEEMSVFSGVDGKQVVQVTAKDWAGAEKLLQGYYEGKGVIRLLDGYAQIRKDLPAEGTALVLVDFPTYVATIFDLVKPIIGMQGVPFPQKYPADAPAGSAGYVGFAAVMKKDRAAVDVVISAECIRVIYIRFVAPFLRAA